MPIRRITYQQADNRASGIAAIGRSLEHANFAWATVSWIACLPGIQQMLQLITDAVGGGPRSIDQAAVFVDQREMGGAPWRAS